MDKKEQNWKERGWIYEEGENIYKKFLPSGKRNPLYGKWVDIKSRCYNKNVKAYHRYGGRGIFMCDEWLNNPKAFIYWCINHPTFSPELQIDRIDNSKGYFPENCHFVTQIENAKNRKPTEKNILNGKKLGKEWGKIHGAKNGKVMSKKVIRLDDGMVFESAKEAKRQTGARHISECSHNKKRNIRSGGYRWAFYTGLHEHGSGI